MKILNTITLKRTEFLRFKKQKPLKNQISTIKLKKKSKNKEKKHKRWYLMVKLSSKNKPIKCNYYLSIYTYILKKIPEDSMIDTYLGFHTFFIPSTVIIWFLFLIEIHLIPFLFYPINSLLKLIYVLTDGIPNNNFIYYYLIFYKGFDSFILIEF